MFEPDDLNQTRFEDLDAARLRRDLKALYGSAPLSSTPVDDAMIAAAQRHFAGHRRSRLLLRAAAVSAAAASITLVVWLTTPDGGPRATAPNALQHPSVAYHEIAQGKRVDIRDAFMLAKRLEAAEPLKPQWDFNGDGHIDRADVDAIAMAAVKLDGGAVQ